MKLFRIINLIFLFSVIMIAEVYSAVYNATTSASTYKITVTRIELCESGSTSASCSNPVAIYDGGDSGLIDIASTTPPQYVNQMHNDINQYIAGGITGLGNTNY